MTRRIIGTAVAIVLLYLAISGVLLVNWGELVSGDQQRVSHEIQENSGLWWLLTPLSACGAFVAAWWAWWS